MISRSTQIPLEIIQIAIGNREMLTSIPSAEEWEEAYDLARKHAIAGICFVGVAKIVANAHQEQVPIENDDEEFDESWLETVNLPEELYYTWMQQAMDIQKRNRKVDEQCIELQNLLAESGIKCCLLKGQGIARLYKSHANDNANLNNLNGKLDLSSYRQSGDIDIYLYGHGEMGDKLFEEKYGIKTKLNEDKHSVCSVNGITIENHASFLNVFEMPCTISANDYLTKEAANALQCPTLGNILTPSHQFNSVYLPMHIAHHFAFGGLSMKQILDWAIFVREYSTKVNWEETLNVLDSVGCSKFFACLNTFIVQCFGCERNLVPAYCDNSQLYDKTAQEFTKCDTVAYKSLLGKIQRFVVDKWKYDLVYKDNYLGVFIRRGWDAIKGKHLPNSKSIWK